MSEKLQITGEIKAIHKTVELGAKGFLKREFILETDDKYPQPIKFEVVKDNCEKLGKHRVGEVVTVHFNLRGNEHNGKHYVSLVAWRLESSDAQPATTAPHQRTTPMDQQPAEDSDSIPF